MTEREQLFDALRPAAFAIAGRVLRRHHRPQALKEHPS
jgi:hypothetical protein